jgi:hypothetical protein
MIYRRQPDIPLPHNRTFIVNLADGTSLRIWASSQMVTVSQHRKLHEDPLWQAHFMIVDNPELAGLYSERLGWDLVGLISLMRSEIESMAQLNLRDTSVREELGLSTVSIPSHHRSKQEKRSMGQALELIGDYVDAHPNCTRLEIARGLDRAKSPYLIVQIEWLVTQKVILREHIIRANGAVEYRYRTAD